QQDFGDEETVVEFRFMRLNVIATQLQAEEPTLRKRIDRLRAKLAKQFDAAYGYTPDDNDVIENNRWQGYRLNPYVVLLSPNQIRARQQMSRKLSSVVTSPEPAL